MPSTWTKDFEPNRYPKLDRDIECDAVIIGGGIAGTTAAYLLAKRGKKVVMIDKNPLVDTNTAYTTAFITHVVDTGLVELSNMFGQNRAKEVWLSHKDATSIIEEIVRDESIDCEFMLCPNYVYANDETEWKGIVEEADRAREYGFNAEKKWDGRLGIRNAGYMAVPDQAKFHPLKYLDALRKIAVQNGAFIFEDTEAHELIHESIHEQRLIGAVTSGGTIRAPHAFIATYLPFNKLAELFARKGVYTSYVIELRIQENAIPEGIYEDEENPYHYFRVDRKKGGDRVLLGGRDHRHELPLNPEKAYGELELYWKKIAPGIGYEIVEEWDGQIVEPSDGLALIGTYDDNIPGAFVATGFSGNGMTYGTMAATMFAEFVLGNVVPWKDIYDPRRKMKLSALMQKGKDYGEELLRGYGKSVFGKADHKKDGDDK